jgi:hypothetical protein
MKRPLICILLAILLTTSITYLPATACNDSQKSVKQTAVATCEVTAVAICDITDTDCFSRWATVKTTLRAGAVVGKTMVRTAAVVASSMARAARRAVASAVASALEPA